MVGAGPEEESCKRAKTGDNPKTGKSTAPKSRTATKAGGTNKGRKVKHSLFRPGCCRGFHGPIAG